MIPTSILTMWFRALITIAIIGGGIFLIHDWHENNGPLFAVQSAPSRSDTLNSVSGQTINPHQPNWHLGLNEETLELAAGVFLLVFSVSGGWVTRVYYAIKLPKGQDGPEAARSGKVTRIQRPDGSVIQMETYGDGGNPSIVFSHGWGASSEEWYYVKKYLSQKFQVIVWDQPGMGLSKKPDINDYTLEKFARDLEAVVVASGTSSVILAGHSIGGMITLKFCELFPSMLGTKIKGLILAHTTYKNPVRTTLFAPLFTALEKPVLVPLLWLTIATWPLVWLMNWLSYFNGSAHRSTSISSFAGTETPQQLDFIARFTPRPRPDVLCYGMLGMMKYDVTHLLKSIQIPVLVVEGDKDPVTRPKATETIRATLPKGTLSTLSPAKHMGLIEHYEFFNQNVSEFASRVFLVNEQTAAEIVKKAV